MQPARRAALPSHRRLRSALRAALEAALLVALAAQPGCSSGPYTVRVAPERPVEKGALALTVRADPRLGDVGGRRARYAAWLKPQLAAELRACGFSIVEPSAAAQRLEVSLTWVDDAGPGQHGAASEALVRAHATLHRVPPGPRPLLVVDVEGRARARAKQDARDLGAEAGRELVRLLGEYFASGGRG